MDSALSTPDRDGEPRLSRRLLRWYRYRLAALLAKIAEKHPDIDESFLVEWFAARPETFLVWQPSEHYNGAGYSLGWWSLDIEAVDRALPRLMAEGGGAHQPGLAPPIPAGPIDVEAALEALRAQPASTPAEPRALDLLGAGKSRTWNEACNRFYLMRNRIRRKTPRVCHCCGGTFVGRQASLITCDACKAAGQRRCTGCQEIFASSGRGPRRCDRCRAAEPA